MEHSTQLSLILDASRRFHTIPSYVRPSFIHFKLLRVLKSSPFSTDILQLSQVQAPELRVTVGARHTQFHCLEGQFLHISGTHDIKMVVDGCLQPNP